MNDNEPSEAELKRAISLPMLVFYGVGTIVGGGFYALTGEVAAQAGMAAPFSFLVSALIALVTAFSFAELSARFPVSVGEAFYVRQAFGSLGLSTLVGWLVILTGIVSAAALANAFAGFLSELVDVPAWLTILILIVTLGAVAVWGIGESVILATIITLIEVGGLVFLFFYASPSLASLDKRWIEIVPRWDAQQWQGILLGAYLAFYAFIGFEDMVNVAEEVKQPKRTLPVAILTSVIVSGSIYILVSLVVVLSIDPQELSGSKSPFSLVLAGWPVAAQMMAMIGMLAGVNGALIQLVMASRVAYGLSKSGQGPRWLTTVNRKRQTPIHATGVVTAATLVFALCLPIVPLAKLTSTILLCVFFLVNLSLLLIKIKEARTSRKDAVPAVPSDPDTPCYPLVLSLLGTILCAAFVVLNLFVSLMNE